MIRLYIIFMALLVKAAFSKIQGTYFNISFFPFSDLKMNWPEYAWHITFYVAFAAIAWSYYLQEVRFKRELLIFALLMSGELLDFVLRCNMSWFQVYGHAFSYDSFMFIVFGATVINAHGRV